MIVNKFWLVVGIAVMAGAIGVFAYQQGWLSSSTDQPVVEREQTYHGGDSSAESGQQNQQLGDDGGTDNPGQDSKQKVVNEDQTSNDAAHLTILLNNFGQRESGAVYANATVDGVDSGVCVFEFHYNSSTVTKTADVEQGPTGYYACGLTVQADEFTPKGEWTAQVTVQVDGQQATSKPLSSQIR